MIEPGRAERRGLAGVEIGGDDEQLPLQLAEIIAAPGLAEQPREIGGDRRIVEQAVRQAMRQAQKRFDEAASGARHRRRPEIGERRALHQRRQTHDPPPELAERRTQQHIRLERIAVRPSPDMNIACMSRGVRPLARPAAMKAPALTPT